MTQNERYEDMKLRNENNKLRAENLRYKETLSNASYRNCGGPATIGEMTFDEHHLRIENASLREEDISHCRTVRWKIDCTIPMLTCSPMPSCSSLDLAVGGFGDQQMIVELDVAAMEELVRMAQLGVPLWNRGSDNSMEALNEDEYPNQFGLKSEASRDTAVVIMNHVNLLDILMDVNQWSTGFSGIVSRAVTLEVLSAGVGGNYNGVLQVV